jgi:hypothetical protein
MLKIFIYIVSFCAALSLLFAFAEAKKPTENHDYCSIQNISVGPSEEMVFKAYYNWQFVWMPAGEAKFKIKENKYDYEVTVVGKTYESYNSFFKVNDYFYSKIDKRTMYPKNFVRIVEEGDYRKFDSIAFDQSTYKAVAFTGKSRSTAVRSESNTGECMHDLLSVLYFMRNIKVDQYRPGEFIPVKLYFDATVYPVDVRYIGKEKNKKIKGLGKFNTIKVIPDLVSGHVFKDGQRMNVWVTDDENKLPLIVESPLYIGSAKAVLKSWSNLRHPMTAKLK